MASVAAGEQPQTKRAARALRIGTHNGSFHCDEALAVFLLRQLPEYKGAELVRTRDPAQLAECDVVVDVGGEYDPSRHRYDHHQRGFDSTMRSLGALPYDTKLSSAGLVYLHFGEKVLRELLPAASESDLKTLYKTCYENFIEEVDGIDNGVAQYERGTPRYHINTTVSSRVGRLNPSWLEEGTADYDGLFEQASALVGGEFVDVLRSYHERWLPARSIVRAAIEARSDTDPSGEIIVLETSCPWKAHLFELEQEMEGDINIKYVLFTDSHGKWRVMAVPVLPGSFQSRKALPEPWRGLRDDILSEKCGVDGCIFVHASGFIGGNNTQEGALEMARLSLVA